MNKKIGQAKPKKSKYNNKITYVDGIRFDSKREADYYKELLLLKRSGEVKEIELQPKFTLLEAFRKNGVAHRSITYKADFKVTYKDNRVEIIDVKGVETQAFKIKRKLFEHRFP
ncbi:MAG: DUF1064 domain-containing protein, partial [Spirochaetales bacterium]|nr:DUF1064 domain-containing protein [Spirochaetales bacterium]